MTNKEIIAKVNEELKAQGINATNAQIETAINQVTAKQELTEDAMENVAGGVGPAAVIPFIPDIVDGVKTIVKKVTGGDKDKQQPAQPAGGNGGGGKSYSNTNDGGKQMLNQGDQNTNSNSGRMQW